MNLKVRTRFAPSPTGFLHVGGLRTALYSYLYAKQNGGDFILRIEDTDLKRFIPGAMEVIYKTLQDSGIIVDEGPNESGPYGPYIQTERKDIYLKYAKTLVETGHAYYCFCDRNHDEAFEFKKYDKHCLYLDKKEIEEKLKNNTPYVIRQNMPTTGISSFTDLVFGEVSIPNSELEDQVLIKSDGLPTYNFANVIDDHLMNITHVMRGNEYLSSTPKYNLLYEAFGWEIPKYIHLTPIMKNATQKLSKRYGDANFDDFVSKGFLPEAIINYIALLGWSPKKEEEIFSLDELIEKFSVSGLSKSSCIFDYDKLKWINGEYIKKLPFEKFCNLAFDFYERSAIKGLYNYDLFSKLLQTRITHFEEIIEKVEFITKFEKIDPSNYENKKLKLDSTLAYEIIKSSIPKLEEIEFSEEALHEVIVNIAKVMEVKSGSVYTALRIALTQQLVTPGGSVEMALILGKDESLERLKKSLEWLK